MSLQQIARRAPVNYVDEANFERDTPPNDGGVLQVIGGVRADGTVKYLGMSADDEALVELESVETRLDTIAAYLENLSVQSAGNTLIATTIVGTDWIPFPPQACERLIIVNTTGTMLEVRQDGVGIGLPVPDGSGFTFEGITNADQLSVRRKDVANTPVDVYARWES
jgi:hypothetical protein